MTHIISSPEPKARRCAYSIYRCSGVRPSFVVRPSSTISNMNISATSWPIIMKFYQKHHWDGEKAALSFGPDRIQTLVSMATNSSHRVIMEKTVLPLFSAVFHPILFILAGNNNMLRARRSSKFSQIRPRTVELAALERLKKIPIDLKWEKRCCHFFSADLDRIHFILAGNDDIHESLDEFKIWPDPTTGFLGNR